jgi:hypothetical protein
MWMSWMQVWRVGVVRPRGVLVLTLAGLLLGSCATDDVEDPRPLAPSEALGKADGSGVRALRVGPYSDTAVWAVKNNWEDTQTSSARAAGIAWPADSGLTWDAKFARWVAGLPKIDGHNSTYRQTFELLTPWGKRMPAPSLDCADVWIFLRATFAAWYQLPFYLEAADGKTRVYFGHFGIRTASGRWNKMPRFAKSYVDHTAWAKGKSSAEISASWPTDTLLRSRGTVKGDEQPFIDASARMGAYLDEVHLNKRAGHFIRLLLIYFGTPNLADGRNTFNLKPDALREGDALLYRRARNGSGHTMVVLRVGKNAADKLTVEVASGNVPPRQPKWESQASSKRRFTNNEGGGPTQNSLGETYSHLGGGLKRFRVAKNRGGYWVNSWMKADEASWIDSSNYEAIGERVALFDDLLGEVTPAEKRDALLTVINDARAHLRKYPASCAARERREDAFADLYALNQRHFYKDRAATDAAYRVKDDYVFAKLDYNTSKTCCWNSSNAKMYEVIMDYVAKVERDAGCGCAGPPPVFKAKDGGYAAFAAHAETMGLGALWKPWSADETCPQAGVSDDTEGTHGWTDYCKLDLSAAPTCTPDAGASDAPSKDAGVPDAGPVSDAGPQG